MSVILNIETSTSVCSVAVSSGSEVIFDKVEFKGPSHASLLGVFVSEAMFFVKNKGLKLDAVAVSCGPGSYTGLRIGVSEAKGLCYGLNVPLIAVHTPLVLASGLLQKVQIGKDTLLCPMIDARRMEVYSALYDGSLNRVRDIQADIIDEYSYDQYLQKHKVLFFGDGADKCKETLIDRNAVFIDDVFPLASNMVALANQAFNKSDFVDVAYFEPFYLKEFVTTIPKKKVL